MRMSSPKSRIRYFACRPTPSSSRPTSASGGGSYVFSPVKPSGSYPVNVAPSSHASRRSASACICGASGIDYFLVRAPALGVRGRALRPLGAVPPIVARALGRGSPGRTACTPRAYRFSVSVPSGSDQKSSSSENFPSPAYSQHGHAGEVDRRRTRLGVVAAVLHVDDDATVVIDHVPLVRGVDLAVLLHRRLDPRAHRLAAVLVPRMCSM